MATPKFQSQLLNLQGNLFSFAMMLTSNSDDAYDLLQDTTLKVLDSEDRYVENTNFKGWAFTIMRNLFINNYRMSVRAATVVDKSGDRFLLNIPRDSGPDTPENVIAEKEITAAIDSFADEYRIPFTMHLAGYRYQEIAEKIGLPLGTVKSRIFFVRKQLRIMLADYR